MRNCVQEGQQQCRILEESLIPALLLDCLQCPQDTAPKVLSFGTLSKPIPSGAHRVWMQRKHYRFRPKTSDRLVHVGRYSASDSHLSYLTIQRVMVVAFAVLKKAHI